MALHPSYRLAALVAAAVRRRTAVAPAPRGLPFLGLDHASGSSLELLADLAAHGIFRKYEVVLDLSAGLGASSRWLAARLGCTTVATAPSPEEAAAGASLTRGSHLHEQVHHVAAPAAALPFRRGGFTHVWLVEALAAIPDPGAALAEAFRVLRPGGHLAVQELVAQPGTGASSSAPVPMQLGTAERWMQALRTAGFADLVARDVSARARESAALVVTARETLAQTLAAEGRTDPALAALARERAALSDSLATRTLRVIHLLARRP